MHNETKVNTKVGAVSPNDTKNPTVLANEYIGSIHTPYGMHFIKRGEALDHARMRTLQLQGVLNLVHDNDEGGAFKSLTADLQDALLWMGCQIAQELETMLDLVVDDVAGAKA